MNKIILVATIFLSTQLLAEPVIIRGVATTYAGNTLLVFAEDDYLSHQKRLLGQAEIGPRGAFEVQLDLETIRELRISISSVEALLYAEPGHTYDIVIPAFEVMPGAKTFNRIEVRLEILNTGEGELNNLIRSFDERYNEFVNDHYQQFAIENFRGSDTYKVSHQEQLGGTGVISSADKKEKAGATDKIPDAEPESAATLVADFSAGIYSFFEEVLEIEFFYTYIRYNMAQLEFAAGYSKEDLFEEYFFSRPFHHHHPAYMQFFSMLFETTFRDALDGNDHDAIVQAVNGFREFPALNRAFEDNAMLSVEHVRHMVILLGLRNAYHQNLLQKPAIVELLGKTFSTMKNSEVAQTTRNLYQSLTKNKQGWHLENFTALDHSGQEFSLDSLHGKYVYFLFYADWCTPCLKEIQILEKLHDQNKNDIEFVCISMDENFADFTTGLAETRNQPWTFIYGPSDPLLREKFGLKSLPYAYMINPQGNLIHDYTRKPSEGIGSLFEEIRKNTSETKTGQKTWKD